MLKRHYYIIVFHVCVFFKYVKECMMSYGGGGKTRRYDHLRDGGKRIMVGKKRPWPLKFSPQLASYFTQSLDWVIFVKILKILNRIYGHHMRVS